MFAEPSGPSSERGISGSRAKCQTAPVRYVVGTEELAADFAAAAIAYSPRGVRHAVDTAAADFRPDCSMAYAVCGAPVLIWPDAPFELAEDQPAHGVCVAAVRADGERTDR